MLAQNVLSCPLTNGSLVPLIDAMIEIRRLRTSLLQLQYPLARSNATTIGARANSPKGLPKPRRLLCMRRSARRCAPTWPRLTIHVSYGCITQCARCTKVSEAEMTRLSKLQMYPGTELQAQYRKVLEGWPAPSQQFRVPTRAGDTFVVVSGPQDAPPLVLLHGAQSNSANWLLEAFLWSNHFRVHAVDIVGECGLSAQRRPKLEGAEYAQWLSDVYDELAIKCAALVGMSFGGWVAVEFASRSPARTSSLSLLCPAGIGRQKPFLVKALPLLLLGAWGAKQIRGMIMGPEPTPVTPAARPVRELMEGITRTVRPRTDRFPVVSDGQLRDLKMPVQVIVGRRDPLIDSVQTVDRIKRCLPHASLTVLDEAHHYLPDQQDRVLGFLRASAGNC